LAQALPALGDRIPERADALAQIVQFHHGSPGNG
jgi:hypothetical protein